MTLRMADDEDDGRSEGFLFSLLFFWGGGKGEVFLGFDADADNDDDHGDSGANDVST